MGNDSLATSLTTSFADSLPPRSQTRPRPLLADSPFLFVDSSLVVSPRRYDEEVPRRQRSFIDRIKDHIGFSLIAVVVLFLILRVLGVRATISALVMSLLLTLGLNVGLSYYYEWRARREALNPPRRRSDTSRDSRGQVEWFREDEPARHDDYRR